jgi:hypothetical protein
MCGGWKGRKRRIEKIVADCAAAGPCRAAVLPVVRRERGAYLLLREFRPFVALIA